MDVAGIVASNRRLDFQAEHSREPASGIGSPDCSTEPTETGATDRTVGVLFPPRRSTQLVAQIGLVGRSPAHHTAFAGSVRSDPAKPEAFQVLIVGCCLGPHCLQIHSRRPWRTLLSLQQACLHAHALVGCLQGGSAGYPSRASPTQKRLPLDSCVATPHPLRERANIAHAPYYRAAWSESIFSR